MQRVSFVRAFSLIAALTLALFPQAGLAKGFRILHTFQGGTDGSFVMPGLTIGPDGSLYGTTAEGGNSGCFNYGCGTVFKIAGNDYSVLYRFGGVPDGALPNWGVVADKSGNLYGTTSAGGGPGCANNLGCGSIFKLSPENAETVLYAFSNTANPMSGLVRDKQGNLFGVLPVAGASDVCGGLGCGSVFRLSPGGELKILYDFQGGADGVQPQGSLIRDDAGNLYGVTRYGGGGGCSAGPIQGCGTVFKIDSGGKESVIYAFQAGDDGGAPLGPLIRDAAGNLYGTTEGGGAAKKCHCGTVFKVTPDGVETILHSFKGHNDGYEPFSSLAMDAAGNLYGTTTGGGGGSPCECGTIFRISPDGSETILHRFDGSDSAAPLGLIMDKHGNLFGAGAGPGFGVVFEQKTEIGKHVR